MNFSLFAAISPSYRQILRSVASLLKKAERFCAEWGLEPARVIQATLTEDMGPFAYQVKSLAVHSSSAIEGDRKGVFVPDTIESPESLQSECRYGLRHAALKGSAASKDPLPRLNAQLLTLGPRFPRTYWSASPSGRWLATFVVSLICTTTVASARPELNIPLPDWTKTGIADHDLGGGVHMLQSFGGNTGVVIGGEGVLLVDAEYPQLNARMRARIAAFSPLPVRYVIDTHWHWDHVGANGLWARTGAVIFSSNETRSHIVAAQRLTDGSPGQPYTQDRPALPVVTLGTGDLFHVGGQTVEIVHVPPAHTDGDLVVRFVEANVIQTGDTFFHGFYPDIDIDHGGSIDGMITWYDTLFAMCDARTKIIPGHGDIATREDVRAYQAMLTTVRARVSKAIATGMSEDQLIAAHPLDDLDRVWGGNVVKQPYLLAIVYEDLKMHAARSPNPNDTRIAK